MSNLSYEEYKTINSFIEKRSIQLMKHEEKDYSPVGFPISNYMLFPINGKSYYRIATNTFISIIDDSIKTAIEKYPELFGTGNSKDVIKAIYLATEETTPYFFQCYCNRIGEFEEFIKKAAHCYIIEYNKSNFSTKILRIDLFRKMDINKNKSQSFEFTGGLFHCFKHFSISGVSLSTGKEKVEIFDPIRMINYIAIAFFENTEKNQTDKGFTTTVHFDEDYDLFLSFYEEKNTEVYFLNTAHKKKKNL